MTTLKLNPEVAAYDPASFGAESPKVNGSVISSTQLNVQEALFVQLQQLNAQRNHSQYQIDCVLSPRLQTVVAVLAQYLRQPTVPNDYHLLAQERRALQKHIKAYQETFESLGVNLRYTQKAYQRSKHETFVVPEDPETFAADGTVIAREAEEEVNNGIDRWVTWVGSPSAEVTEEEEALQTMGSLAEVTEAEHENDMDETDSKGYAMDAHTITADIEADLNEEADADGANNKNKRKDGDGSDGDRDDTKENSNSNDGESRDQEQRRKKKRKRRKRGKKKTSSTSSSKAKQKSIKS